MFALVSSLVKLKCCLSLLQQIAGHKLPANAYLMSFSYIHKNIESQKENGLKTINNGKI